MWSKPGTQSDSNHKWLARQLLHLGCGAGAFFLKDFPMVLVACGVVVGVLIIFAVILWRGGLGLLREGEGYVSGAVYYAIGLLIAMLLFSPEDVFVGWLILSAGDSASTIVGRNWPLWRWPGARRSVGGSLGFFVASLAVLCVGLAWWHGTFGVVPYARIILVSAVCAAAEVWTPKIDDNLYLPVLAALVYALSG
ncbi:MAG: hypothetical protein WCK47_04210 [bacterium]|nr:hypothetical protein [Candidatus Sumerlaeota bacterium]